MAGIGETETQVPHTEDERLKDERRARPEQPTQPRLKRTSEEELFEKRTGQQRQRQR